MATEALFNTWMNGEAGQIAQDPAAAVDGTSSTVIACSGGVDFFIDPKDQRTVANAPFWYRQEAGDFSLAATVQPAFAATFDAGALMAMIDDTHWVKLAFEFTDLGFPAVVSVVTQEFSDDANGQKINAESVRLRISRRGNLWALHWADVGTYAEAPWRMVRYFRLGKPGDTVKVGLEAQCPTGTAGSAEFTDIVLGEPPQDMRVGQ
ncbi:MAG: DUF1349 domain-containing protein [Alkalispirochaeta sp.]